MLNVIENLRHVSHRSWISPRSMGVKQVTEKKATIPYGKNDRAFNINAGGSQSNSLARDLRIVDGEH